MCRPRAGGLTPPFIKDDLSLPLSRRKVASIAPSQCSMHVSPHVPDPGLCQHARVFRGRLTADGRCPVCVHTQGTYCIWVGTKNAAMPNLHMSMTMNKYVRPSPRDSARAKNEGARRAHCLCAADAVVHACHELPAGRRRLELLGHHALILAAPRSVLPATFATPPPHPRCEAVPGSS